MRMSRKRKAILGVGISALLLFAFLPLYPLVFETSNPTNNSPVGYVSTSALVFGPGLVYFPSAHCADFYLQTYWTNFTRDTPFPFTGSLCKP